MKQNSKGMSLIECIIAIFLVVTALMGLISVYPSLFRQASQEKNRFIAVAVAEGIIEAVRSHPYGRPVPPELTRDRTFVQYVEGQQDVLKIQDIEIKFDPPNTTANSAREDSLTCEVTVTIKWEEGTASGSAGVWKTYTTRGTITR